MSKKATNQIEYVIRKWGDYDWWMIDRAHMLSYDIDFGLGGGIQHNLPDDKGEELQSYCEAVIASMVNLHKFLEENTPKEEQDDKDNF